MQHFVRIALAAILTAAVVGGAASAANAPEHVIKYRQNLMKAVGGHISNVALLVKGQVDFSGGLGTDSQAIVDLLKNAGIAFPEGTAEGKTKAKPEIWQDRAKFDAALEDTIGKAEALAMAAAGGDMAAVGAALGALGKSCGACHKSFRIKDE